jgi:hypothetical protein
MAGQIRVRTADDSFLTRNRGCGDLVIWPLMLLVGLIVAGCFVVRAVLG